MTEGPGYRPDRILRTLGLRRRIGHVITGLAGFGGAIVIAMLWATESDGLPLRTEIAFAALILIGAGWATLAVAELARRPLFAIDRVIAGWLAVSSGALLTVGLAVMALTRSTAFWVAASLSLALTVVASVALTRARSYHAALRAKHRDLESGRGEPSPDFVEEPMSVRTPAPVGPLAIAIRHVRPGRARVAAVAILLAVALVAGVALLLR